MAADKSQSAPAAPSSGDIPEPYDESEVEERGTPFMLASRPPKSEPGSSAADVDGAESPSGPRGHHESVGERQGRQPGSDRPAARDVRLLRDGTIFVGGRTEIDFRTPDYSVWLTIKGDDAAAEAAASALEATFGGDDADA